jgi:hypothetical protein
MILSKYFNFPRSGLLFLDKKTPYGSLKKYLSIKKTLPEREGLLL